MRTPRFAIEVKWDRIKLRYVARVKKYPELFAFGSTIAEAMENMERRIKERCHE